MGGKRRSFVHERWTSGELKGRPKFFRNETICNRDCGIVKMEELFWDGRNASRVKDPWYRELPGYKHYIHYEDGEERVTRDEVRGQFLLLSDPEFFQPSKGRQ